jgi:glucokinase
MIKSEGCILLGDIGATNARFALAKNGIIGPITNLKVAEFGTFSAALHAYYRTSSSEQPFHQAMVAVAGPVHNACATLTNAAWVIDAEEVRSKFGLKTTLVNDFEAVAYSVPSLTARGDVELIGPGGAEPPAPIGVLGPGTGLGVACLVAGPLKSFVIASEGGHATLSGTGEREDAIIRQLRLRFGHVSAERAISGPGLENLFNAIAAVDEVQVSPLSAPDITENALAGKCPLCVETLNTFCAFLGSFAGNIALTFQAAGGIYIAGGISPRIVDFMRNSDFRQRFEAKGRFSRYLRRIPSFVIMHPASAFLGLMNLSGELWRGAEQDNGKCGSRV